jgi:hypothetical protein
MLVLDCEVYRNYFLLMLKKLETGKYAKIEMFEGQSIDPAKVSRLLASDTTISFNGNSYDLYIIAAALAGWKCLQIKELSDDLIKSKLPAWKIAQKYDLQLHPWDHVDLFEVAPGKASLKIYGGRLNAPRMQDLPIEPDAMISADQAEELKKYCANDLDTTEQLYRALEGQIRLREEMGQQYGGIDLRSKSDAQIAEAVIKHELTALTGKSYKPRKVEIGSLLKYEDPGFVEFQSPHLREFFWMVLDSDFPVGLNGSVQLPKELQDKKITIGDTEYKMGIGGLHSCEKSRSVEATSEQILADFDVASYYPNIILKQRLSPKSMGANFLTVYKDIVARRLKAKAEGDKVMADTLKIVVNGSFGKLGSMYSSLYAPELMIQTTVTGQLCLLMLIEMLESSGAKVVSANTDGVVVLFDKTLEDNIMGVTFEWSMQTSFELERSDYRSLHSRDVNNYIAVKLDGKTKRKGVYADPLLNKNADFQIVSDAIANYLSAGTSLSNTILTSSDVTRFVHIRTVTGGAVWRGQFLGKAVRFYYSSTLMQGEAIHYARNSNRVPRSEGAKPMMELPEKMPCDMDYGRYLLLARAALADVGVEV